ncbi:MAG: hypothetical protein RQ756_03210 [Flavobacteriaceae bacterium]|nr:hypothetical protein [Flavobacteriaceae bacterium]
MNNRILPCFLILFAVLSGKIFSQNESLWHQKPELRISGFMDLFYAHDFNNPVSNERQDLLFNHNWQRGQTNFKLSNLQHVASRKTANMFDHGLLITTRDSKSYKLIVNGRDEWLELLKERINKD